MSLLQKQTANQGQTQNSVIAFACRIFLVIKCKFDATNAEDEKMQKLMQKIAAPWIWFTALGLAVFTVLALTTIVPLGHWMPISVTEQATVIAVTEKGCVIESSYGYPVIISNCNAQPGETIQATYNMPAIVQSEYIKRVQAKAALVQP